MKMAESLGWRMLTRTTDSLATVLGVFNWDDLKVFLAAYRAGSIGRAAESLGLSGSTVSRRLAALEESLGSTLFLRTPEGLRPTDDGERTWAEAQQAEQSAQRVQAMASAQGDARGMVRVSVATGLLSSILVPSWPQFSAQFPGITVEFVESTTLVDLERWEADIAIRNVRPTRGDELVFTKLRETRAGLFAARRLLDRLVGPTHDEEALVKLAAGDGEHLPFVDWTTELSHLALGRARETLFPRADVVLRSHSMETIRCATASGVGLGLLPAFFGLLSPTLVELPCPRLTDSTAGLYLVGHSALRDTPRVEAVWRFLDDLLRGDGSRLGAARTALADAYGVGRPAPGGPW